jgi:hypothetical protein
MANSKISALTSATTPLAGTETLPVVQSSTTKQVSVANLTAGRAVTMLSGQVGTKTTSPAGDISSTFSAGLASASAGTAVAATLCNTVAAAVGNETQLTFSPASNYSATGAVGVVIESIITANSALKFYTYNAGLLEAARIDSGGNYIPKNAAKGINFTANTPAAGMTSQLLNWYEEGTWTPVLTFATPGDLAVTYSQQVGVYTRIGNKVFINFSIITSAFAFTTSSGALILTGLPFVSKNLTGDIAIGSMYFSGITQAGYTQFVPRIAANTSTITFIASASALAAASVTATNTPTAGTINLRGSIAYDV